MTAGRWTDHLEICDVLHRFALALDTRDPLLYRQIMTDELEIDYSSWRPDEPARRERADDWVRRGMSTMRGLDATQHSLSNIRTTVTGDTAEAMAYVVAAHFLATTTGDSSFVIHGSYRDSLVRTPEGWKLSAIRLDVRWMAGNRAIMTMAKERSAEG